MVIKQDRSLERKLSGAALVGIAGETARLLGEFVEVSIDESKIFDNANRQRRFRGPADPAIEAETARKVETFVRRNSRVAEISGTIGASVRSVVRNNATNPNKIIDGLEDLFRRNKAVSASKSLVIARTESNRVANFITQTNASQIGDTHKQWVWSGVSRDGHAALDGTTIALSESFVNPLTGNSIPFPNGSGIAEEDINCSCTMITLNFVDDEEAAEAEALLAEVL